MVDAHKTAIVPNAEDGSAGVAIVALIIADILNDRPVGLRAISLLETSASAHSPIVARGLPAARLVSLRRSNNIKTRSIISGAPTVTCRVSAWRLAIARGNRPGRAPSVASSGPVT